MAGEKPGGRHACGLTLGLKLAGCFGGSAPLSYRRSKSIVSESRRDAQSINQFTHRGRKLPDEPKKYVPPLEPSCCFPVTSLMTHRYGHFWQAAPGRNAQQLITDNGSRNVPKTVSIGACLPTTHIMKNIQQTSIGGCLVDVISAHYNTLGLCCFAFFEIFKNKNAF